MEGEERGRDVGARVCDSHSLLCTRHSYPTPYAPKTDTTGRGRRAAAGGAGSATRLVRLRGSRVRGSCIRQATATSETPCPVGGCSGGSHRPLSPAQSTDQRVGEATAVTAASQHHLGSALNFWLFGAQPRQHAANGMAWATTWARESGRPRPATGRGGGGDFGAKRAWRQGL